MLGSLFIWAIWVYVTAAFCQSRLNGGLLCEKPSPLWHIANNHCRINLGPLRCTLSFPHVPCDVNKYWVPSQLLHRPCFFSDVCFFSCCSIPPFLFLSIWSICERWMQFAHCRTLMLFTRQGERIDFSTILRMWRRDEKKGAELSGGEESNRIGPAFRLRLVIDSKVTR